MRILALDPSSQRTGYAVMEDKTIIEAGYLRASDERAIPRVRIDDLADEVEQLIKEAKPAAAIVEVTSGRIGTGWRRGAGARLAVYGMAVGAIYMACRVWINRRFIACPTEREWTGEIPKARRQRLIAGQYPGYAAAMAKDSGGDVADAIGLGLWWLNRKGRLP